MPVTNAFRVAVSSNDVRSVRIMMKDSLLLDATFSEFQEMESASNRLTGLYDIHDGEKFEQDKTKWDDAYMTKQQVRLISNFSHERITHLKDIISFLHPASCRSNPAHGEARAEQKPLSYKEQKRCDQKNGSFIRVAEGAAAGTIIGASVSHFFGLSVTGWCVLGAAVGCATGLYLSRRNKEHR